MYIVLKKLGLDDAYLFLFCYRIPFKVWSVFTVKSDLIIIPRVGYCFKLVYTSDLMVAYLTNTGCWLQLISKKGYMSLQGKNILLTPVHDWIHNCIWDWIRK